MCARRSFVILIAIGLTTATTSFAEGTRTSTLPELQRETLELNQRQSRASQGVELDAGERLDLYHLQMRQRREQQWLQERHRLQLEGRGRRPEASAARQLHQQQILKRERQQEMRRFDRELERWRRQQQDASP